MIRNMVFCVGWVWRIFVSEYRFLLLLIIASKWNSPIMVAMGNSMFKIEPLQTFHNIAISKRTWKHGTYKDLAKRRNFWRSIRFQTRNYLDWILFDVSQRVYPSLRKRCENEAANQRSKNWKEIWVARSLTVYLYIYVRILLVLTGVSETFHLGVGLEFVWLLRALISSTYLKATLKSYRSWGKHSVNARCFFRSLLQITRNMS